MVVSPNHAKRLPAPQTTEELRVRALALAGHTVAEVAARLQVALPTKPGHSKGFIGSLAELALGADPTARDRPDFPALGVELKTVPVNAVGYPVESTFCCKIAMATADREEWETSRLRQRLHTVLWLPVEKDQLAGLGNRRFGRARLWTPSATQTDLLQADWEDLIGALGAGRVPSAHEGKILQLRPKAANRKGRALSPGDGGTIMALPLGFYLRARFTATILLTPENR
ncbi:MAG: hypothetical protein A2289_26665 [Deltaproteobacteria bacterium RIFOXYA12_FULL_58_15]|nr:MAG: hypothetical protein A2289_26665 [Deltaproteobacteria bacterium RIFOXYA12_FULL_58_15]OGR09508.1 MAG: hypothetical protein A2341_01735 [Deltaproteobacteria bacterium RIFOXYB12_FULL_58_9]